MDKPKQKMTPVQQSEFLCEKYRGFIPITVRPAKSSHLPSLKNRKFMFAPSAKLEQLIHILQKEISNAKNGLYLFNPHELKKIFFNPGMTVREVWDRPGAVVEGWLNLAYSDHESF